MSHFFMKEDGYYSLTTTGTIVFCLIIAILVILTAFFKNQGKNPEQQAQKETKNTNVFSTKQLVFSAAALALGFVTSYIKIIDMPWGGSLTLCSMLFITLIGYWYGPKTGLIAGLAYGVLQFIQDGGGYILSPLQVCMDYIFAFAALGLSGFFRRKTNGLIKGYLFAIFVRGLFHTIGGYLYWMEYMPDSFPKFLAPIYPIAYNYSFILAEGVVTIVILSLPPIKNAMARVKTMTIQS